jgi:hypothetical protein
LADSELEILLKVVTTLEDLGVQYLIGGSYASSTHGLARPTKDIDLLVSITPEQGATLAANLQSEFYADDVAIVKAIRSKRSFNVIHLDSSLKIDFFVAAGTGFSAVQLKRRRLELVSRDPEVRMFVASPEDTVLAKLSWYRSGGEVSERQWVDVQGVLRVQGVSLDFTYLISTARELHIEDLLERALNEAGINAQ